MPVRSRDLEHLPALVKAHNCSFYTNHGQYDLRKMYEEWRAGLVDYRVPRLCRLDQREPHARLPLLPPAAHVGLVVNATKDAAAQKTGRRLSQHSASSPPTCRTLLPLKTSFNASDVPPEKTLVDPNKRSRKAPILQPQKTFNRAGRFQCITKIGQGSYGTVFKCRDRQTDSMVAIKRFRETDENPSYRKIAHREIRILTQLRHSHIVTLLEVFRRKKRIHLVFEYLDRTLLDEIQRSRNGIPEKITQKLMSELLQALLVVHQHECLHRDVKPENILLTQEGSVKLCDFGFARSMTRINDENDQYTEYVATRWYRAPELLLGTSSYGPGVDIWAVGCVLYECLTRYPLLPGTSDIDQFYLIEKMFGKVKTGQSEVESTAKADQCSSRSAKTSRKFFTQLDKTGHFLSPHVRLALSTVLRIDPAERPSASNLLQEPFFSTDSLIRSQLPVTSVQSARHTKKTPVSTVTVVPADCGYETASSPDELTGTTSKEDNDEVTSLKDTSVGDAVSSKSELNQKLPKISTVSAQLSVDSGEGMSNDTSVFSSSTGNVRIYALRPSLSRPDFLPSIIA